MTPEIPKGSPVECRRVNPRGTRGSCWCSMECMAEGCCNNLVRYGVDTVLAALKSAEILARGVRCWQRACLGTACMVWDDTIADARCRLSCRSLPSLLSLERDLLNHRIGCSVDRGCMLWTMAVQTAEDVSFPLHYRLNTALSHPYAAISA